MARVTPEIGQRWTYKEGRGFGTFTIVSVTDLVTMRNRHGKEKTISLRTLRGDYELVPRV